MSESNVSITQRWKPLGLAFPILLGLLMGLNNQPMSSEIMLGSTLILAMMTTIVMIRCMGAIATLSFASISMAIAWLTEEICIRFLGTLTHFLTPQIGHVPFTILLGWYVALAVSYAFSDGLMPQSGAIARVLLTPIVATIYDLTIDPKGLAQGLWQWNVAGTYGTQLQGVNGMAGIPWINFLFWIVITAIVTAIFEIAMRVYGRSPQFDGAWAWAIYIALCCVGLEWLGLNQLFSLMLLPVGLLSLLSLWKYQSLQ